MWTLFWLLNVATIVLVYVMWIRPILLKTPTIGALLKRETSYFCALSLKFAGIKQRLTAAVIYLAGIVVTMHDYAAPYLTGVDTTPFFPKVVAAVPAQYWPLIMVALTALLDYFRYLSDRRKV